ncbi:GAF domain-containing protein [Haladaptatus sp. DYF46]|uniref:GAF domain-containing protein n=1 Tax=Haladaptatus sp. DYF46 TaxID=2886041 RepID=UPI001E45E761|nr:GAF domain-containing protein [Haladaptatus sp. DYF46]
MDDMLSQDNNDMTQSNPLPSDDQYLELLASVQRLTGIGIWSYNTSTTELWWSNQAKRIHEIDIERTLTLSDVVDQYTEQDQDRVAERFSDAIENANPFDIDVELTGEGTTPRSIRLHCEPKRNDETLVLYGVVRDLTDMKRREQRIEILRRTSQQLRGASSKQEVAEILANAAKNILGLVNTTVRLVNDSRNVLRTVEATEECLERAGDRPNYSIDEETPAVRTYLTSEPEIHSDHQNTADDHDRGELQSGLYVPIGSHGVLSAGDVVVDAFKEHDLEAASLLGQLGAEAITRIGWVKRSRAI